MSPARSLRRLALTAGLLASVSAAGCDLVDAIEELEGNRVGIHVYLTHHASPQDGTIPDFGGDGEARVFENDQGWTITLLEGFITTQELTLHRCDGAAVPVDLYWGSIAEDLRAKDMDLFTIGGVEVTQSQFCGLSVVYGPFDAESGTAPRSADLMDGNTVLIHGYAKRGEEMVPFEIDVAASVEVYLDLSTIRGGGPLTITGREYFPVELTLAKTYDLFFDGIDFATMDPADLEQQVLSVLELETTVTAD